MTGRKKGSIHDDPSIPDDPTHQRPKPSDASRPEHYSGPLPSDEGNEESSRTAPRYYGPAGAGGNLEREDHRGKGPKGYRRSDERIREDVCDRLTADRDVDASDIEVSVTDGVVTLNGQVRSKHEKRCAEDCLEAVAGIGHIQNNLRARHATTGQAAGRGQGRHRES